ncbi:unnamed protein product [Peronospora belbahrii]|uniref:Uncharacterized protein n=1 Tax=Peronospora belbahrii TaxID=622444 RepID=A0ABN8D3I4_9STRA|nr:unnamed protein product [Peronospora belbahrii]
MDEHSDLTGPAMTATGRAISEQHLARRRLAVRGLVLTYYFEQIYIAGRSLDVETAEVESANVSITIEIGNLKLNQRLCSKLKVNETNGRGERKGIDSTDR